MAWDLWLSGQHYPSLDSPLSLYRHPVSYEMPTPWAERRIPFIIRHQSSDGIGCRLLSETILACAMELNSCRDSCDDAGSHQCFLHLAR